MPPFFEMMFPHAQLRPSQGWELVDWAPPFAARRMGHAGVKTGKLRRCHRPNNSLPTTVLTQQFHHVLVIPGRRTLQRRFTASASPYRPVHDIDVGPMGEEQFNHFL